GFAAHRLGIAVGARTLAEVAEDGGVHGEVFGHPDRTFGQAEPGAHQRIGAGLHPAPGLARATTGATAHPAEESLEHITQPAETGATETTGPATGLQRIAAHIDDAAFLRIRQHLVRGGDLFEPGLRGLVGVHVGMQFASQFPVRAFELLVGGVFADTEQSVVIPCHLSSLSPWSLSTAPAAYRRPHYS